MKIPLKQNMGIFDRILRVCAGAVLLVLGTTVVTGSAAIMLMILTIPLLIPGITGFCPAYVLFGISTRREGTYRQNELESKG